MQFPVRARLSTMMGLLYAVQGAWWPLLALHLGDLGLSGRERGWIFATYPLATLLVSLGAGALVDRRMASERYLGACYGLGGAMLLAMAIGAPVGAGGLVVFFLVYWGVTAPTHGVASAIAFRNLPGGPAGFGRVRLWGTVGWMVAGWGVSATMALAGSSRSGGGVYESFWVAALLSMALAGFARMLPHTPPLAPAGGSNRLAVVGGLVRSRSVAVYLVTAFGVSLTTPFVYQALPPYLESLGLPRAWASTALTLGQWPEVVALAALPRLLGRLGIRGTLLLGMVAWLVRFGTLALGAPLWLAVAGIPLHGIGIACFTVGGQVFLDGKAPGDRRAGAQALNMAVTSGLGGLLGSLLAGDLAGRLGGKSPAMFAIPCLIHVALILFFISVSGPDDGAPRCRPGSPTERAMSRDGARPAAVVGPDRDGVGRWVTTFAC